MGIKILKYSAKFVGETLVALGIFKCVERAIPAVLSWWADRKLSRYERMIKRGETRQAQAEKAQERSGKNQDSHKAEAPE